MAYIPLRSRILNLKSLIVLLAIFVTIITLLNGFYASYHVQKNQLIQNTLDENQTCALKLAASTDHLIVAAHKLLAYSANIIEKNIDDQLFIKSEAIRLFKQTDSFNSVEVVNTEGIVLAIAVSSGNEDLLGKQLTTSGTIETLQAQKPFVSTPYTSTLGNLITLISYPLFDETGSYLGFVAGTIYLKDQSILNEMLGKHYYQDDSYIYVVDKNKQLIYHPDPERVGTYPVGNIINNSIFHTKSGAVQATNSLGIEMLAGFASLESVGWAVVAQRPLFTTLKPLDSLMQQVMYWTLPLAIMTFIAIWALASYISRPLRQLADAARRKDSSSAHRELAKISSWYFESKELKRAMLNALGLLTNQISELQQDAETDPLTGVFNRRGLLLLLEQLEQKNLTFSVLAVDIDHFKQVNDTFGHPKGDKALVALTQVMQKVSRDQDIVARAGGEEFLLVLPNTASDIAQVIAERLRIRVAEMVIEPIGSITVSIGIATSSDSNKSVADVLKQADQALYQAKNRGRNRCEVFSG